MEKNLKISFYIVAIIALSLINLFLWIFYGRMSNWFIWHKNEVAISAGYFAFLCLMTAIVYLTSRRFRRDQNKYEWLSFCTLRITAGSFVVMQMMSYTYIQDIHFLSLLCLMIGASLPFAAIAVIAHVTARKSDSNYDEEF